MEVTHRQNRLRFAYTHFKSCDQSLNVMKTHAMLISTKPKHKTLINQGDSLKLKIRNDDLEVAQKTKYLGVQIDNKLHWKEQIKTVSSKVSRAIGFVKHAKSILPENTLRNMYTGIVEPHFRYCCSVWGCCGLTEINQLQKLQNRAARVITGSRFDAPGLPLVKRLGWKTIDELISSESNIMVFKTLHGLAPQCMSNLFTKTSQLTSRNLRNSATDLRVPKKKSTNGQKCFSFRGAKSWNGLSAENASTMYKFKRFDNQ